MVFRKLKHKLTPAVQQAKQLLSKNRKHNSLDELSKKIDELHANKVLDAHMTNMLKGVLSINNLRARDLMIPRAHIDYFNSDDNLDYILTNVLANGHSRYPILSDDQESIGLLFAKDLLKYLTEREAKEAKELQENLLSHNPDPQLSMIHSNDADIPTLAQIELPAETSFDQGDNGFNLTSIMKEVNIIPESKLVTNLLQEFQTSHTHLALVVNEFGEISGLITIEDILEEIVGDISDEFDAIEQNIRQVSKTSYDIIATTELEEFNEKFGTNLDTEEFETIGGYLVNMLGHVPQKNDTIELENGLLVFRVVQADSRKIIKLRLRTSKKLAKKLDMPQHNMLTSCLEQAVDQQLQEELLAEEQEIQATDDASHNRDTAYTLSEQHHNPYANNMLQHGTSAYDTHVASNLDDTTPNQEQSNVATSHEEKFSSFISKASETVSLFGRHINASFGRHADKAKAHQAKAFTSQHRNDAKPAPRDAVTTANEINQLQHQVREIKAQATTADNVAKAKVSAAVVALELAKGELKQAQEEIVAAKAAQTGTPNPRDAELISNNTAEFTIDPTQAATATDASTHADTPRTARASFVGVADQAPTDVSTTHTNISDETVVTKANTKDATDLVATLVQAEAKATQAPAPVLDLTDTASTLTIDLDANDLTSADDLGTVTADNHTTGTVATPTTKVTATSATVKAASNATATMAANTASHHSSHSGDNQ